MPYLIKINSVQRGPIQAFLLNAKSARERIKQARSQGDKIASVERRGDFSEDEPQITEAEWRD
jgi:hypothetical protein